MGLKLFLKFFSRALMLLLVMPLTNSAKGLVAKWQGDDTSEREGRITLNPMAHLDPLGSLAILLCGFGWSKPMPISPVRMKDYRRGVILLSLTGPVTHFLSAIVCNFIVELLYCLPMTSSQMQNISPLWCLGVVLVFLSNINVCLGTINLLPLPPMDGFNILHQFAGNKFNSWYYSNYQTINRASTIILLVLFFMPELTGGMLDPLGILIAWVSSIISLATAWVPAVFG
ncbi:MAG: site-2 protease family protein [Ruminococcus sp.]|nr:site-2 protease family protein [Ruminococcus sp.]